MNNAVLVRGGLILIGLVLMVRIFWLYANKRLTVDLSMAWEAGGAALIVIGAVPAFSRWCALLSSGTAVALLLGICVAAWAGLRFSMLLSTLQMKVQELALEVSLLKAEQDTSRKKEGAMQR